MVFHGFPCCGSVAHWLGQNDRASRKIGQDLSLGFPPVLLIFSQDVAKNHPFFWEIPGAQNRKSLTLPSTNMAMENHQKITRKSPEITSLGPLFSNFFSWNERYGQIFRPTSR